MLAAGTAGVFMPLVLFLDNRNPAAESGDPIHVAKAFYRATYARDFSAAYAHLSAADRRVKDKAGYLYDQASFAGFALELMKRFAAGLEFEVIRREMTGERARLTVGYKVPAADELSPLLFNWDQNKLNALPRSEQRRIIAALEEMHKAGNIITIEGREVFDLVKEDGRWKIHLDWASGINVAFDAALPPGNALDVEFLSSSVVARQDEPFQTNLKLRNRGQQELVARIDHRIEPEERAGLISMIACGFVRPLTLHPGEEREVSSAYLLDASFPKGTALKITYLFRLENPPSRALQ